MDINNFTTVPFNIQNLDTYYARQKIMFAIDWVKPNFSKRLLDIGCGKMPYKDYILSTSNVTQYIGLDIYNALEYQKGVEPDFRWDGKVMPFENESFECSFATEVLEHCPNPNIFLEETYRVLKNEGVFFFTVPFLWNLHETPHDEYRYTPFSLKRQLINSGFVEIEIYATGGWHASLAQMLGLWVRRSPMSKNNRMLLSYLLKPFIKLLIKKDRKLNKDFFEGQMITGLYGKAKKKLK